MDDKTIGARIAALRKRRGLTMADLAGMVKISQAQVSRLENGRQGFRSKTLSRIAESLGVSSSALLLDNPQYEPVTKLIAYIEKELELTHWNAEEKHVWGMALQWAKKARDGDL